MRAYTVYRVAGDNQTRAAKRAGVAKRTACMWEQTSEWSELLPEVMREALRQLVAEHLVPTTNLAFRTLNDLLTSPNPNIQASAVKTAFHTLSMWLEFLTVAAAPADEAVAPRDERPVAELDQAACKKRLVESLARSGQRRSTE